MSNKRENQFYFSKIPKLTVRYGNITFGGSGSVATSSAGTGGVAAVTKLGTGIYQIQFVDNFYAYVQSEFNFQSGTTGAAVGDGTFVASTVYQIVSVGNTDWGGLGLISGYGTAAGMVFVASGTGDGAKTGTAKVISTAGNGIVKCAVIQSASAFLKNVNPNMNTGTAGVGASIIIQTLGASGTDTMVMAPASPTAGAILEFAVTFRDSSAAAV